MGPPNRLHILLLTFTDHNRFRGYIVQLTLHPGYAVN